MKKVLLVAALAIVLVGCATRPESIPASYVSYDKYMGSDCSQLATAMNGVRSDLQKFSAMQESAANKDAATVFLFLIPASLLTGDHAAEVAESKGEVEAIEIAQAKKGCKALKA